MTERQNIATGEQMHNRTPVSDPLTNVPAGAVRRDDDAFEVRFSPAAVLALRRDLVRRARRDMWGIERDRGDLCVADPQVGPPHGVRRRVVCSAGLLAAPGGRAAVDRAVAAGAEYRVVDAVPASLLAVDGVGLVPLGDGAALVLRSPALYEILSDYFELLWAGGRPYPAVPATVPAAHLRVLRLAADGLRDDEIARQLGISVRSVRRYIEALENRLDATNRLTLGVAAARHGWI